MGTSMKPGLSKSKILSYRQCPKRLWLEKRMPEVAETSDASERAFAIGHAVGAAAQSLLPNGFLVEYQEDLRRAVAVTREALAAFPDRPIFEAAFDHDGVLIRADVLIPEGRKYRLCEVKAASGVKDYYLDDCAVQAWVLRANGLVLSDVELLHIDTSFVYPGGGRYEGLFSKVSLDGRLPEAEVPDWVDGARTVLSQPEPTVAMGPHCDDPFTCPFKTYCARNDPPAPDYPVASLPRGGKLAQRLADEGFADLRDVPVERLTSTVHRRVHAATVSGMPYVSPHVANVVRDLAYPRYFMDFETARFAVPIWAGTRPYQQVPFQWSVHVEHATGHLEARMFLHLNAEDPREAFLLSLLAAVGDAGPVLAYYASFERSRIEELADAFPQHRAAAEALTARIVDLHPIAREHYYHRDMRGSWSLKAVLPTVAPDLDYANLEDVQEGGAAEAAFQEAMSTDTTPERRDVLRKALEVYCARDTLALVRLVAYFSAAPPSGLAQ